MLKSEPKKAKFWTILDRNDNVIKKNIEHLTEEEKRYPLWHKIHEGVMIELVDEGWAPEKDPRL